MNRYISKKIELISGILFSAALLCGCAIAEQPGKSDKAEEVALEEATQPVVDPKQLIKTRLMEAEPRLRIASIQESEVPGYYKVISNGGTWYVSEDSEHLFMSDLWLVDERLVNTTELARTQERYVLLQQLDESEMLVFAPEGEIKRTLTVFTDIDCGYSRKLHNEVPALNEMGISVRYLAFPRAGLQSPSYDKIVSAWCADDPLDAMTRAKMGIEIEPRTCSNPVASHLDLVDLFGVTGTPAIILENGELIGGYLPADRMGQVLGLN